MYREDAQVCMPSILHVVVHVMCIIACVCNHMFMMIVIVGV